MAAPLAAPLPESPSRTPVRRRIPRRGLEVFLPRAVESVADLLDTNRDTEEVVRDVFYTHGQGGAIDPDSLAAVIKEALLSDVPEGTSVVDDLSALIDQHKKTEFAVADLNHHRQLDFEEFVIYFNRLKDLIADAIRADARKRRGEVVNPESQEEELATPAPLRPSAASDGGGGLSRRQSFGDSSMAPMVPKSDEVSAMLVTSMQASAAPHRPMSAGPVHTRFPARPVQAHFLFRELDQTQLSAIAAAMFERRVAAGETACGSGARTPG